MDEWTSAVASFRQNVEWVAKQKCYRQIRSISFGASLIQKQAIEVSEVYRWGGLRLFDLLGTLIARYLLVPEIRSNWKNTAAPVQRLTQFHMLHDNLSHLADTFWLPLTDMSTDYVFIFSLHHITITICWSWLGTSECNTLLSTLTDGDSNTSAFRNIDRMRIIVFLLYSERKQKQTIKWSATGIHV